MNGMVYERIAAGVMALGGTDYCLALGLNQLKSRYLDQHPLINKDVLRHQIADLYSEYHVLHDFAYNLCNQMNKGRVPDKQSSILKLRATELEMKAASICLRWFGASGYSKGHPAERIHRDAHATTVAAETSEIMKDLIAAAVIRDHDTMQELND